MNTVTLALSNSTFTYDGRPINNIDIQARGRVNQTRAEIHELVLRRRWLKRDCRARWTTGARCVTR